MLWSMTRTRPWPCRAARAAQPPVYPEARVAGPHNGLVPMFNGNLIEDPCDVVANRLYGKSERGGDLRIVEALGDPFQHGALTRREFIERQRLVAGSGVVRLGKKPPRLVDQSRPCRLVGERHMVFAVELNET